MFEEKRMTVLAKTIAITVAAVLACTSPAVSAGAQGVVQVENNAGSAVLLYFLGTDGKAVGQETYVVRGGVYRYDAFERAVELHVASPKCNVQAHLAAHYYGRIVLEPTCQLVYGSDGREIPKY